MIAKDDRKVFLITCLAILLAISCSLFSTKREHCPIADVLIDSSNLPGDQWEEVGSRSYRSVPSKLGINRIGTSFSTPLYGIALEHVYLFENEEAAITGYIELADLWFRIEPESTDWEELKLPKDTSINANDYRLECSVRPSQKNRTCWYIARYKEIVIEFKVDMVIVEDEDLFRIIEILGQKVKSCDESSR